MNTEDIYIRQIEVGVMQNFVYLIGCLKTRQAVAIDMAWDIPKVCNIANADDMQITALLVSHTHPDHVGGVLGGFRISGVEDFLELQGAPIHVHKAEAEFLHVSRSDLVLTDAHSRLTVGDVEIEFIHTPGHTPGSQCFKVGNRLISGDTLFIGSCGRTDLPGGNPEQLYESITDKLMRLDEATRVFPGHNYAEHQLETTIGQEKQTNPFFSFSSKTDFLRNFGYAR